MFSLLLFEPIFIFYSSWKIMSLMIIVRSTEHKFYHFKKTALLSEICPNLRLIAIDYCKTPSSSFIFDVTAVWEHKEAEKYPRAGYWEVQQEAQERNGLFTGSGTLGHSSWRCRQVCWVVRHVTALRMFDWLVSCISELQLLSLVSSPS